MLQQTKRQVKLFEMHSFTMFVTTSCYFSYETLVSGHLATNQLDTKKPPRHQSTRHQAKSPRHQTLEGLQQQ